LTGGRPKRKFGAKNSLDEPGRKLSPVTVRKVTWVVVGVACFLGLLFLTTRPKITPGQILFCSDEHIVGSLINGATPGYEYRGMLPTRIEGPDFVNAEVIESWSGGVVRLYNKRGTAERWIKEGKQAVKMTRLSCHRFRSNEVRLWLSVIAYNLGNLWRRLALPRRIGNWSLTSLQQRLVKTGGRLVRHARYYWLLLAEGHLSRRLFGSMLRMIAALPLPDG